MGCGRSSPLCQDLWSLFSAGEKLKLLMEEGWRPEDAAWLFHMPELKQSLSLPGCCPAPSPPLVWRTCLPLEQLSSKGGLPALGWTSTSSEKKMLTDVIHAVLAAAVLPECTCFISWPSRLLSESS